MVKYTAADVLPIVQLANLQVVRSLVHFVCDFFNHDPLTFECSAPMNKPNKLDIMPTCVLISAFMSSAMFLRRATPWPI